MPVYFCKAKLAAKLLYNLSVVMSLRDMNLSNRQAY